MHFDGTTLASIQAVHSLECISGNLTSRKVPITSGLERRLQTEYCLGRGIGIQTQEPSIDRKSSGHTTPMSYWVILQRHLLFVSQNIHLTLVTYNVLMKISFVTLLNTLLNFLLSR